MECQICMNLMSTFVIPTCHQDHKICNYCFESMKKEICPFCREPLLIADIVNYASPGPTASDIIVPDGCQIMLRRGKANTRTAIYEFVKKYAPEMVDEILQGLPKVPDVVYKLDSVNTVVAVAGLGKMSLLQYALLELPEDVPIYSITEFYNNFKTILIAQRSLEYALENHEHPFNVFQKMRNEPLDNNDPEVQLYFKHLHSSPTIDKVCEMLINRILRWPNREPACIDRSDVFNDIAINRLLEQGTVVQVDDRYVILS